MGMITSDMQCHTFKLDSDKFFRLNIDLNVELECFVLF